MTYLTKNLEFFSNLDGMQAICAEKMCAEKSSSETPCGCFGTTNKIFFTNDRRLQRLYPVEQILCGFHGVLAAKGHPHAARHGGRQRGGLLFQQGGVHTA